MISIAYWLYVYRGARIGAESVLIGFEVSTDLVIAQVLRIDQETSRLVKLTIFCVLQKYEHSNKESIHHTFFEA